MKKILILAMLSLTFIACDPQDKEHRVTVSEDADNSGKNIRDRDANTKTPLDQSESEEDLAITQKIRQALISDSSLSMNAKNIKIITNHGLVTLRGPVANAQEKEIIEEKVNEVSGVTEVDNQIEIIRNP